MDGTNRLTGRPAHLRQCVEYLIDQRMSVQHVHALPLERTHSNRAARSRGSTLEHRIPALGLRLPLARSSCFRVVVESSELPLA